MLLTVVTYTLLAAALCFLGYRVNVREQRLMTTQGKALPFFSWEICLAIALVTLVIGFRWQTGNDYPMYYKSFEDLIKYGDFKNRDNFEIGYYLINKLISFTHCPPIGYFAIWTFLQVLLFYFALRNHKFLLPWMGFLLILGPASFNWLTFLRQWTISFLFLAAVPWIINRKALPYFLMVMLAATVHKSAILLALFYFAPYLISENPRRWVYLAIFSVCVLLGIFPQFWFRAFSWIFNLIYALGYDKYNGAVTPLLDGNFPHYNFFGARHLITLSLSVIFIWFYPALKKHFVNDKFLQLSFVLAFVCVCYTALWFNTHAALTRPADYLFVFRWIMLAYVMAYLKDIGHIKSLILVVLLSCAGNYISYYKLGYEYYVGGNTSIMSTSKLPYRSYFFK